MSDIFNWSSIAKFKPFQTTSPEWRHFQRHHGVLWFCLDAGSLMLISANTKSTFKKKLETGHQQAKLRAWRNSAKYQHSNQKSPDIFPVQWLTVCACCLPHLAINLRCPRLSNHGAAPRVAAPETACHPQCKWKPVALGDMHSRISAKREKDCLGTFDQGLSSQGNRLSASNNIKCNQHKGRWKGDFFGDTKEERLEELRVDLTLTSSLDSCASVSRPWRRREI